MTALRCSVCIAVCCSVLQYVAELQCVAECCSVSMVVTSSVSGVAVCVWQCVAVSCSVLQCVAVCCSVLQCVAVNQWSSLHRYLAVAAMGYCDCVVLQCVCCSLLQCVEVCCSGLQRVGVEVCCSVLQCINISHFIGTWR